MQENLSLNSNVSLDDQVEYIRVHSKRIITPGNEDRELARKLKEGKVKCILMAELSIKKREREY
jgi:hypothetical protein